MPCHPAPGRRLLIIRNDNIVSTVNVFLGFDGVVQGSTGTRETAYKRPSSLANLVRADSTSTDFNVPAEPSANSKKRWSLLGRIMPFNSADSFVYGHHTPTQAGHNPTSALDQVRQATATARLRPPLQIPQNSSTSSLTDSTPSTPTHRPFSFKFSLEWTSLTYQSHAHPPGKNNNNNSNSAPPNSRRLPPPRLPAPAHIFLVGKVPSILQEVGPKAPLWSEAKYAGRALAEWALVVKECNNFVERRKAEGVPGLKEMEVPVLGVEGFRKYS